MSFLFQQHGSQRFQPRAQRPSVAGVFQSPAALELTSMTRPGDVSAFLSEQNEDSYVRVVNKPPRIYTTAEGTDLLARQKLQRFLLASVIGPVERMRGNEEGIQRLKVEIQPGTPGMTTARLNRAITPLCEAEQSRAKDQSTFLNAWEKNQPIFEQYIKTYDFYVVRIVLSWLTDEFDQTGDGEMTEMLTQAILDARLVNPELRLLSSVANDLEDNKTWMSKVRLSDNGMAEDLLALVGKIGRCASELLLTNGRPAEHGRQSMRAEVVEHGSLVIPEKNMTPGRNTVARQLDLDEILEQIGAASSPASRTPPRSPVKKPANKGDEGTAAAPTTTTTTTVTASEPALSAKNAGPSPKKPTPPELAVEQKTPHPETATLPAANSAPSLPTQQASEVSFLQQALAEPDPDSRAGRRRTADGASRTGRHRRRSMSPARAADSGLPNGRGQRKSMDIDQLLQVPQPRPEPYGMETTPANSSNMSFKEFLVDDNYNHHDDVQRSGAKHKKNKIKRLSEDRKEHKAKQKPPTTPVSAESPPKAAQATAGEIWQGNANNLFTIFPNAASFLAIARILDNLPENRHRKGPRAALKSSIRQCALSEEEKNHVQYFLNPKNKLMERVEDVLRHDADSEFVIEYLHGLKKVKL